MALAALAIAILAAVFLKGFLGVIPILIGIVGGYVVALLAGQVSFEAVKTAAPIAVPPFVLPEVHRGRRSSRSRRSRSSSSPSTSGTSSSRTTSSGATS